MAALHRDHTAALLGEFYGHEGIPPEEHKPKMREFIVGVPRPNDMDSDDDGGDDNYDFGGDDQPDNDSGYGQSEEHGHYQDFGDDDQYQEGGQGNYDDHTMMTGTRVSQVRTPIKELVASIHTAKTTSKVMSKATRISKTTDSTKDGIKVNMMAVTMMTVHMTTNMLNTIPLNTEEPARSRLRVREISPHVVVSGWCEPRLHYLPREMAHRAYTSPRSTRVPGRRLEFNSRVKMSFSLK